MMQTFPRWPLALGAVLVLLVSGCSGAKVGRVSGKVEMVGAGPLADAEVEFWPVENRSNKVFGGWTNADGTFEIRLSKKSGMTAKPGRYVATVKKRTGARSVEGLSEEDRLVEMMKWTAPSPDGKGTLLHNEIDPKYSDPASSKFEVDIEEGDNDLPPFKVEKAPPPKAGKGGKTGR
jgi:hypothetical protein